MSKEKGRRGAPFPAVASGDSLLLRLERLFEHGLVEAVTHLAVFTAPFVIKTAGSDAASSRTIVSATPYGTYPGTATATLNSTIVTFEPKDE